MPRIRQLPTEVITKIAAGEVIERPASVVKELLENSVDAGAGRIDIDIENGGAELIRVADDGCGISPDDLPLAFASHATSKLTDADDLFRVRTLGFRGEALASMGGVAQVRLQSRQSGSELGAEVGCDGGKLSDVQPWNGARGTRIEVRHLFFNTPVRRKFLRATVTEMGHIAEVVTKLALAQPNLAFKLTHNDRLVYEVPASAGLRERLGLFFGPEVRDQLIPLETPREDSTGVRLFGYIADPACNRGNPRMQYLFLNGRWIRDRALGHAVQEAYRGLIMTGRYCVVFLFLEMPPDAVDVNVHPTKVEVRFRDSQALYHLVLSCVREQLRRQNLTPTIHFTPHVPAAPSPAPLADTESLSFPPTSALNGSSPTLPVPPSPSLPLAGHKAIQFHDAYILLETPEGMLVIDQHALHERVLYEEWKSRLRSGCVESQRLLVPEPIDLPGEQAAAVLEHQRVLEQLGLGIEDFGGGTVLITSYPALMRNGSPSRLLRAAVEYLAGHDRPPTAEQLLDDLLRLMACKSAIKAGDHLGPEEIAALAAQRHLADNTHHCPHGRPTALFFSKHELDRHFKRV